MSYSNKFAAAVKVAGKVLRENKETVFLPFGCEYSMLLKNLNSKRALVNVFIDGENHTPGGLVLNAGQEVDLERSLKNGSLKTGNRFKFIERTAGIEQHRGIKLEDGLVRIEIQYELNAPVSHYFNHSTWNSDNIRFGGNGYEASRYYGDASGGTMRGMSKGMVLNSVNIGASAASAQNASVPANDAGITVAGSKSDQAFVTVTMGALEAEKTVIVFKLTGETADNQPIAAPVTVKHKPQCTSCGKHNKANSKFCSACGTALEIYA